MEGQAFSDAIRSTVEEYLEIDEPAVAEDYVLLCEVKTLDGSRYLFAGHSAEVSEWAEIGMLEYRLQDIYKGGHAFLVFDPEGEE